MRKMMEESGKEKEDLQKLAFRQYEGNWAESVTSSVRNVQVHVAPADIDITVDAVWLPSSAFREDPPPIPMPTTYSSNNSSAEEKGEREGEEEEKRLSEEFNLESVMLDGLGDRPGNDNRTSNRKYGIFLPVFLDTGNRSDNSVEVDALVVHTGSLPSTVVKAEAAKFSLGCDQHQMKIITAVIGGFGAEEDQEEEEDFLEEFLEEGEEGEDEEEDEEEEVETFMKETLKKSEASEEGGDKGDGEETEKDGTASPLSASPKRGAKKKKTTKAKAKSKQMEREEAEATAAALTSDMELIDFGSQLGLTMDFERLSMAQVWERRQRLFWEMRLLEATKQSLFRNKEASVRYATKVMKMTEGFWEQELAGRCQFYDKKIEFVRAKSDEVS